MCAEPVSQCEPVAASAVTKRLAVRKRRNRGPLRVLPCERFQWPQRLTWKRPRSTGSLAFLRLQVDAIPPMWRTNCMRGKEIWGENPTPGDGVALLSARLGQELLDPVLQLDEISAWLLIAAHDLPVVGWAGMDVPDHAALVDEEAH